MRTKNFRSLDCAVRSGNQGEEPRGLPQLELEEMKS